MKNGFKQFLRTTLVIIVSSVMLNACTATVKVPKHPGPGEPPPPPPKVEIHNK